MQNQIWTSETDYECQQAQVEEIWVDYEYRTRNDGWMLSFMFFSIAFGPELRIGAANFPVRFVDFVILFFFLKRWMNLRSFYGGLLFSARVKLFSGFIFTLTFLMLVSLGINTAVGATPFVIRDFFWPIIFVRMTLIAAITGSANFGPHQVRQFGIGLLVISLLNILLAMDQKFGLFGLQGITMRFYGLTYEQTEEQLQRGLEFSRVSGSFGNTNVFGGILDMLSGLLLAIAINTRRFLRIFSIIVYLLLGFTILFSTASRTGLVVFVMITGLGITLSMRPGSRLSALTFTILALSILFILRGFLANLPLNPRIAQALGGGAESMTVAISGRFYLWTASLQRAAESPLIGVGPSKILGWEQLTDNGYLMMLMRLGILGLLTYVIMLISIFIRSTRILIKESRPWQKAILLGCVLAFVTHMLFEITGDFLWRTRYNEFFAAVAGMICGAACQLRIESDFAEEQCQQQSEQNLEE